MRNPHGFCSIEKHPIAKSSSWAGYFNPIRNPHLRRLCQRPPLFVKRARLEKLLPVFPGLSDAVVRIFIPLPRLGILCLQCFAMNLLILSKGGYQLGRCFLEFVHSDQSVSRPASIGTARNIGRNIAICIAVKDRRLKGYTACCPRFRLPER